jgi:hypothetical protein
MDKDVLPLVEALNRSGFKTFTSCSGACERCLSRPYIGFIDNETATSVLIAARTFLQETYGALRPEDVAMISWWSIQTSIVRASDGLYRYKAFFTLPLSDVGVLTEIIEQCSFDEARKLLTDAPLPKRSNK